MLIVPERNFCAKLPGGRTLARRIIARSKINSILFIVVPPSEYVFRKLLKKNGIISIYVYKIKGEYGGESRIIREHLIRVCSYLYSLKPRPPNLKKYINNRINQFI